MSNLELRLHTERVPLRLGEPLEAVQARLDAFQISRVEDQEMGRVNLRILGEGVELGFQDERLATVFLFLSPGDPDLGVFAGETDMLDRSIFDSTDEVRFAETLQARGFGRSKRKYPFATDLLNATLRLRLEKRPDQTLVLIDDGSFIR